MTGAKSAEGMGSPAPEPKAIAGDLRKFSEYVLVLGHVTGKDRIFL